MKNGVTSKARTSPGEEVPVQQKRQPEPDQATHCERHRRYGEGLQQDGPELRRESSST